MFAASLIELSCLVVMGNIMHIKTLKNDFVSGLCWKLLKISG